MKSAEQAGLESEERPGAEPPGGPPIVRCAVRSGSYHDSIVLMRLQRALADLPGVLDAGVVMATPANLEVLAASGLAPGPDTAAGPNDLLIAVKAESSEAAGEALARVDALLALRKTDSAGAEDFRPRSLATAVKQLPEARWVMVSVPGRHAASVAHEALDLGRNVFLYSDNVSLADELALKRRARERGLLVLGPDCGTAIVGGVGLGFANQVRRGAIGLVGASGTGLQAVTCHLHARGAGISQAIGTGGRDLSAEISGLAAAQALDVLRRDPGTRVIVLISKPPAPEVAARLLGQARATGKPVVVDFLGAPRPTERSGDLHWAAGLAEAAEIAARLAGEDDSESDSLGSREAAQSAAGAPGHFAPSQRWLRGLFSGGTLAGETIFGLSAALTPLHANASFPGARPLPDSWHSREHTILDLGADELTVGRLHPMIDFDLRLRRLRQEAADPEVAMVLLDVVLGHGAHADPAGELAPAIERARAEAHVAGRELAVAAVVIGTDEDPQDLAVQIETLERSGARVFLTVDGLVEHAIATLGAPRAGQAAAPSPRDLPGDASEAEDAPAGIAVPLEALAGPVAVINVGLELFYDSLRAQGAPAVQVEWRPPAGGDEKLAGILARLKGRGPG